MSAKPEALRLADEQENCAQAWIEGSFPHQFRIDTAIELRRLHTVNTELLETMREVLRISDRKHDAWDAAHAAIAKATT